MSHPDLHLHHAGIVVRDLEASATWYRQHLGFEIEYAYALPGSRALMLRQGPSRLELIEAEGAAPLATERQRVETTLLAGGTHHAALGVADMDALVADLTARGVEVVIAPTAVPNNSGDRFAFIRDGEGMLLELFQPAG